MDNDQDHHSSQDRGLFSNLLGSLTQPQQPTQGGQPQQHNSAAGLLGNLVGEIKSGHGLQGVLSAVEDNSLIQKKIDAYAAELKQKASVETERSVYQNAHTSNLAEALRKIVEEAIDKVPINPPGALGGAAAQLITKFVAPAIEGHKNDKDSTNAGGIAGFVQHQIQRQNIDGDLRRAALRAVERYMQEHKQFLMSVAVEALIQKLSKEHVTGTTEKVPYQKPPAISVEQFNQQFPITPDDAKRY